MTPAFYWTWHIMGALALATVVLAAYWWLTDRNDIVTRYSLRALTAGYRLAFGTALLLALVPA